MFMKMSSNVFFCPTNSPNPRTFNLQWRKKYQIITFCSRPRFSLQDNQHLSLKTVYVFHSLPLRNTPPSLFVSRQAFMEDVKSRGPFIYSVLESAQAFLAQHPFQEPEETLTDGKGLLPSYSVPTAAPAKISYSHPPSANSSFGRTHAGEIFH